MMQSVDVDNFRNNNNNQHHNISNSKTLYDFSTLSEPSMQVIQA